MEGKQVKFCDSVVFTEMKHLSDGLGYRPPRDASHIVNVCVRMCVCVCVCLSVSVSSHIS